MFVLPMLSQQNPPEPSTRVPMCCLVVCYDGSCLLVFLVNLCLILKSESLVILWDVCWPATSSLANPWDHAACYNPHSSSSLS